MSSLRTELTIQNLFFTRIVRNFSVGAAFVLAVCVGGCSGSKHKPESTISGTVKFQGQPVTGGTLTFEVTTDNGKIPCAGQIESDGSYEVTNAIPGKAHISVETATREGLPDYFPLPSRFADPSKSGLEYKIQEGNQQHNIVLE